MPSDPAFAFTVEDLALDQALRLPCACRVRTFSRRDLVALVGCDARLHLIGLRRELWCDACREPPLTGWVIYQPAGDRLHDGLGSEPLGLAEPGGVQQRPRQEEPRKLTACAGASRSTTPGIDVVRAGEAGRELASMRWGLIPAWWKKSAKEVPATFNARAETVAEKSMFCDAFKRRRCIISASGFYEWTGAKKDRQPHLFTAADGAPVLAFAGLWDRWRDPAAAEEELSCTMIVSGASAWMEAYHDRMPVLLSPQDFTGWLDGTLGAEALHPAPADALREWPVSKRMNASGVGDDDPTLLEPLNQAPGVMHPDQEKCPG